MFKNCEEVDEGGDGGSWSAEEALAKALGAVRHKLFDGFVGQQILCFIATGVDMTDLGQQHVEVFRREAGEAHDRPAEIDKPVASERVVFCARRLCRA